MSVTGRTLMTRRPARDELAAALLVAAMSAALLALAYVGLYARYMADDYCTAASLRKLGFLAIQRRWYTEWTGRFSFSLLLAAAESAGPAVVPFLPASAVVCWVAGAVWSVYRVAVLLSWPRPLLTSLVLGELVVFATLNGAHNIAQSLYWQSGMLTYVPPLVLFTLYVGVACRAVGRRLKGRAATPETLACGALTLLAGGFSESHALLQVGALALALAACYGYAPASLRRAALPPLAAGLAGALAALCVVVLAPGNAVRMGYFPVPPGPAKLLAVSLFDAAGFVALTVYLAPLTALMSVALPALFGFHLHQERPDLGRGLGGSGRLRPLLLPPLIGFVMIFLCTVPSVYGTSGFLPERARVIPGFVFVCVAVWWGLTAGVVLSGCLRARRPFSSWARGASAVAALVLLLPPVAAVRRTLALVPGARAAAAAWDEMDRDLREAGGRGAGDVTVAPLSDVETRFGAARNELQIERDAHSAKNRCVAQYYGIGSVRAE
jgi:hypothetical protein